MHLITYYYAITQLIYSIIERRDRKFLFYEILSMIFFVSITNLIILNKIFLLGNSKYFLSGLTYIIFSLVTRVFVKRNPIETGEKKVKSKA